MKRLPLFLVLGVLSACAPVAVRPGNHPIKTQAPVNGPHPTPAPQSAQPHATPAPAVKPTHAATPPVAVATPQPGPAAQPRPGAFSRFFGSIFGGSKPKPNAASQPPTPEPNAEPLVQVQVHSAGPRNAEPASTATANPAVKTSAPTQEANTTSSPGIASDAQPATAPEATPKPERKSRTESVTPPPSQETATAPEEAIPVISHAHDGPEKQRYRKVREKAATDPDMVALRHEMENAAEGEAYKSAAHRYVTALFSKMRKIDPEFGQSLGRKEDAYHRRVDSGKLLAE